MRAKRKADYHHGRLRQALIETAVKTIAQHGVDALSLRELAARAGVSPGAPYHHFPNRSELLASIAEDGFTRLEAQLIAARDAAPENASARLEALGLAYVTFAVSSLGYFRVMFHGGSTSTGPTEAGLRTFNILRDAVVACQQLAKRQRATPPASCSSPGRPSTASRRCGSTAPCPFRVSSPSGWRPKSDASSRECSRRSPVRLDLAGARAASSSRPKVVRISARRRTREWAAWRRDGRERLQSH